ncbi:MAG TPA: sialidase family protein [Anaerolineae bacterium]|nr:sialidase family protein [Anaerolineae bacterium]
MKTRIALWAVAAVVVLAVVWRYVVPVEWRDRVTGPVVEVGHWALVGEQKREVYDSFGPWEFRAKMPKTNVAVDGIGFSFTFKQAIWRNMGGPGGYNLGAFNLYITPEIGFGFNGVYNDPSHPGQWGLTIQWASADPWGYSHTIWYDVPSEEEEVYWIEVPVSLTLSGNSHHCVCGSSPIGAKGATHAKEQTITESYVIEDDASLSYAIGGTTYGNRTPPTMVLPLGFNVQGLFIDSRDWVQGDNGMNPGVKYVMSIEDIKFGDVEIDTSTFTARNWGSTPASAGKLWVEGFGGNSIGFWASEFFDQPPYTYDDYTGGTIGAPYSIGVNAKLRLMDDTEVDDSLLIVCPTIRNIDTDTHTDLGPKEYTYGAFKALRYTQRHGCYYWDSNPPDVIPPFKAYIKMSSAEALGYEIRGPRPAFKVEGCGWSGGNEWTEGYVSPYDGQYAPYGTHNGEPVYSNGYAFLYCTDPSAGDWGLGPGPPTAPYYIQDAGGPSGVFVVNTDSYSDAIIFEETGQRQFSGLFGEGLGPAVSEDTTEAVATDADCATPSFQHNATLVINGWGLDATSRTVSPYMIDIVGIAADANQGVYANAHDHTDWVGVNCTTPDSGGNFTVGAGGGSLTLTLKCNYRDRQAAVGAVGAIAAPEAYRERRHDSRLGEGDPPETAEAVWDWRGRYLSQAFKGLTLPCDLTVTIRYYMDLLGVSDNHKTDSTRQTDYAYTAGDLYTLTRTIPVSYADGAGWATVLVDLYDEANAGQPVAMAYDLKWDLPAGTYQMAEPQLVTDPGDRQEVTSVSPYYREAPSGDGLALKVDESWRYAQGVVSMVYNGLCNMALFVPDHAKGCVIERCLDTLDVKIGAQTGQDLTSCYPLSGWPLTKTGEALSYSHSAAAEEGHMKDADDAVLKTLAVSDIVPQMQGGSIGAVAVRCATFHCVNGLPYVFDIVHYVHGRGHGMAVTPAADAGAGEAFPRKRSGTTGDLYARPLGSTDEGDWTKVDDGYTVDEHGHWTSDAMPIVGTDEARTLREYALRQSGAYASLGRFATREFALLQAIITGGPSRPALCVEPVTGICHLAYVSGEDVRYTQSDPWIASGFRGWRYGNLAPIKGTPQTIAVFEGGYTDPSVVVMPGRTVIVSARSTTAPYPVTLKRSLNQGRTWEDVPVGSFVADLTQLSLTQHRGVLHGAGIIGNNAVYRYSDDGGTTANSLDRTATVTATICAAEDEQPDIVRDPTGVLYVTCNNGTAIVIMTSSDGGNTWAETDSIA